MSGDGSYAGAEPGATPEGARPRGEGDGITGPGTARQPVPPPVPPPVSPPVAEPVPAPVPADGPATTVTPPGSSEPAGADAAVAERPGAGESAPARLFSDGERGRLAEGLHGAVTGFVDGPHDSVAEAERVFAEASRLVIEGLAHQDRVLGDAWKSANGREQTEELRVALQRYRQVTERLLEL